MLHFASNLFHRPPPRHAKPVTCPDASPYFPYDPKVPGIATRPLTVRQPLSETQPDFTDATDLPGLTQRASDGFTIVMKAVEPSDRTQILPAAVTPLPSQRTHDALAAWYPPVSGDPVPVTALQRSRPGRRVPTGLPPRTAVTAEDSYESLAAYPVPVTHRAAVDASWFREGVCDQTRFDRYLQSFVSRRGLLPNAEAHQRPAGGMDTQVFTALSLGQFSNDSEGSAS